MKKLFIVAISVVMLMAFTACEQGTPDSNVARTPVTDVNTEMREFMTAFFAVNNQFPTGHAVTNEEVLSKMTDSSFESMYIDLGSFGEVESVELSGIKYTADSDIMSVSVGKGAFYKNVPVYKIDEATGDLLVNRASLLFSIIAGKPVVVNGIPYDDYSVGNAEPKAIDADSIFFGGKKVTAEGDDDAYTITVTEMNTKLSYKYEDWAPNDKIYVITRDSDTGEVTQNSLLISGGDGVYAYLTPWDAEVTTAQTKHMNKEGFVLSASGELKGSYKLNLTVEFKGSESV